MGSWDILPAEIIAKIAKEIESHQDIKQFQLTCKNWAPLAQQQLYADIELVTEHQLRAFTENITSNPSLGLFVERLRISTVSHLFRFMDYYAGTTYTPSRQEFYFANWDEYCAKPRDYFAKLTEYCPNVRQILDTRGFGERFWKLLIRTLQEGKWNQVHLIEPPTASSGNLVYYGKAVWEIRDRLTELQISDELHQLVAWHGQDMGSSHSVAEKILAFPKVQNLTLMKEERCSYIYNFNEYIDNCVSLKRLTVHCQHLDEDSEEDIMFKEHRILSNIFTIKQQHAVKKLDIVLSLINNDTLAYIVRKFPSLSALRLIHYKSLKTECSYEINRQFLEYASKIPFIQIKYLEMKNMCELLPITFKDRIKYGKRETIFEIEYCSPPRNRNRNFRIEEERNYFNHRCRIDALSIWDNDKNSTCNIDIFLDVPEYYCGSALPHVTLIENLGNEITSLQLKCQTKTGMFTNIARDYFLDHILANCFQMERLNLDGAFLVHCSPTLPVKKHLNSLVLYNCDIYPGLFKELSPLLPSLGSLQLDRCRFISEDGEQLQNQFYFVMSMPHTSVFRLYIYIHISCNSFCAKVKVHGKKEMYYAMTDFEHPEILLTGPEAKSYYLLNNERCFVMDIELFSLTEFLFQHGWICRSN
jgi:hypothetical protein